MERPSEYTLSEWEDLLSSLFGEIHLIGEIPLSDVERVQFAQHLRTLVTTLGLTRATEALAAHYPRVFVTYLALTAARNEERGFWDVVAQEVGVSHSGQFLQPHHHWGKLFIYLLKRLGLEAFDDIPAGTDYVPRIRLHGGIPAYSLPDFFRHILMPAVERTEYVGLEPNELLSEVLQRSEVEHFVDNPVRLFLTEAGDVALDFFRRCLDMARTWKTKGEIPPAHEVGLPAYVVDIFHDFVEGRIEAQRGTRLRPPRLYLDPLAPDVYYFLDLPSQPIAASQTDWRYTWRWEVTTPTGQVRRGETRVRVTRQGDKFWTHTVERVPLDVPPGKLVVSFTGYPPEGDACEIRRWRFPLVPDERRPVLAFRAEDGCFLSPRATIPADKVWLLFPAGAQVQVIGQGRLVEKFPHMYGEWGAWRVEAWVLTEARGIRLLDENGRDIMAPMLTSQVRGEPELMGPPPPWQEFDPEETSLFVGEVPLLRLPRVTTLSPREEMARWQVEIYRQEQGACSPCVSKTPLPAWAEHVRVEESAFLLPLDAILGDNIAGIFEVTVHGPSRVKRNLAFRVWPAVNVESLPPYILPEPKGHVDITFHLRLSPDAKVEAQVGVEDVAILRTDEPGHFRVRVGRERTIVPLLFTRRRDAGLSETVPVHIGIPRLRWLLALEGDDDLAQPQASVISRPTAALLQSRRTFLILDWTVAISPDQLPPMRLALVDPSERVPRVLQECDVDKPRPGQHRQVVPLGPFADTIRAHRNLPLLSFDLVVLDTPPQRLPLVHLTRAPDIDEVHLEWRDDGRVYVHWHEPRPLRHRRLNLWPVSQPWRAPVQVRVPDTAPTSDAYAGEGWWMHDIGSHDEVPPGVYRLSFSTAHPWEPLEAPPQPPEEAFLVAGLDVSARLRALEAEASTAADPFFVHFERAALYDYLGHRRGCDEAVRVLLDSLPAATPEQIVALVKWLEPRDPLAFKEARITMYRAQVLDAKGILSEEIQPSLRRAYMQWFVDTRLLRVDTLERVLESPGDVEWKAHALSVLLRRDVEKAVFYGLLLLDEGTLAAEDLVSIFATAADDVVRELRRHYPEQRDIIEALIPHLSVLLVCEKDALIETDAGIGTITKIRVGDRYVPRAFLDEEDLYISIRIEDEYGIEREAIVDCTRGTIQFPGARTLYWCGKCQEFVSPSAHIISRHHRAVHAEEPGVSFPIQFMEGDTWQMKTPIKILESPSHFRQVRR